MADNADKVQEAKKTLTKKGLVVLGVVGAIWMLKKIFGKSGKKPGYYEKAGGNLGGKIDDKISGLAGKAESLIHPGKKH